MTGIRSATAVGQNVVVGARVVAVGIDRVEVQFGAVEVPFGPVPDGARAWVPSEDVMSYEEMISMRAGVHAPCMFEGCNLDHAGEYPLCPDHLAAFIDWISVRKERDHG